MKKTTTAMMMALALGLSSFGALAQQSGGPPPGDNPPPQGGPPEGGPGQDGSRPARRPRPPLEAALDANGDGIIDSNEIANASAELKTLDKNHDGQLTPDEYRPHRPHGGFGGPPGSDQGQDGSPPGGPDQGRGGPPGGSDQRQGGPPPGDPEEGGFRPPRPPIEAALDVNGDGIIDSNEIANASAELKTLDKNNDGQLTPNEYRPKRPHGRGFGGPPPGGPDQGQGGPDQQGQQPPPDDGMQPPPGPPSQNQ